MKKYKELEMIDITIYKLPATKLITKYEHKDFGLLLLIEPYSPYLSIQLHRLLDEFLQLEEYRYANAIKINYFDRLDLTL